MNLKRSMTFAALCFTVLPSLIAQTIEFYTPRTVRVIHTNGAEKAPDKTSLSVIAKPEQVKEQTQITSRQQQHPIEPEVRSPPHHQQVKGVEQAQIEACARNI